MPIPRYEEIDHEARALLIEEGIYSWYLRPSQLLIYEHLHRFRRDEPFIEAARRFGKTTGILPYVMEQLRRNPGWVARWLFPDKDQAKEVITPELENIQFDAFTHSKFTFYSGEQAYISPEGSKLYLGGVNKDRGHSQRGPFAHIIVADEFGYWKNVREIEASLKPQLLTTRGQWIYASTPPEDLGHVYYSKKKAALRKSTFIQKLIYDNEFLEQEDFDKAAEDCGGYDSVTFKREYLCEEIGDPTKRVVPEYNEALNDIPDDTPRPDWFDAYVGGDSGVDDNTAILFAYYDFINDCVVFDHEYVTCGNTTKNIIDNAKIKEAELWGEKKPFRRVYDADKQLLIDITSTHGYSVYLPEKQDKLAAIHAFRIKVGSGKIKIKKRCVDLRRQLAVGQWKDDRHSDFLRVDDDHTLKHLDAIAAAVYLNRSILTTRNPYPQHEGVSLATHFVPETILKSNVTEDDRLADLFFSPVGRNLSGR